ncbi:MAG: hypothetical protein WDZ62_00030 [Candidatus Pacearchaeota archaeon]
MKIHKNDVKLIGDVQKGDLLTISPDEATEKRRNPVGLVSRVNKDSKDIFIYTKHEIPEKEKGRSLGGLLEIHYKLKEKGLEEIDLQSFFIFDHRYNKIRGTLEKNNLLYQTSGGGK